MHVPEHRSLSTRSSRFQWKAPTLLNSAWNAPALKADALLNWFGSRALRKRPPFFSELIWINGLNGFHRVKNPSIHINPLYPRNKGWTPLLWITNKDMHQPWRPRKRLAHPCCNAGGGAESERKRESLGRAAVLRTTDSHLRPAALAMISSEYLFGRCRRGYQGGNWRPDTARLGAGSDWQRFSGGRNVLRSETRIRGVTTAACLWWRQ